MPDIGTDRVGIVLVEDHTIVRQGVRALLEREPDLRVVGEASDRAGALEVVASTGPTVVLLDLRLTRSTMADGLAVCRDLVSCHPGVAPLVLTTYLDPGLAQDAREAGARGYVVKDADTRELLAAIRAVARGETAFDPRVTSGRAAAVTAHLTDREVEVLNMLARGHSNRTIARRLCIAETTVAFHVRNTLRKLGVTTRAEAVYLAVRAALVR